MNFAHRGSVQGGPRQAAQALHEDLSEVWGTQRAYRHACMKGVSYML